MTFPLIDASGIDAGCEPDTAGWRRGPAGWPDGSAVPLGSNAGPVFVGRSRELDLMAGLLADAAAARPRIVLVEGEAGLGKSSLIAEFLARQREVPVLAASGEVSERALPWGMVRQLAHRADDGLPPESSLLAGGPAAGADPLAVGEELMALFAARSAARGLLRLWTGDLAGADEDLTAVVTRIRGGLRLRYPGQALGYLAETAFRLGRWDEGPGSR